MEKALLAKAVETLAQPTKASTPNIVVLEALKPFQTLNDPQLKRMKAAAAVFATDMLADRQPRWLSLLGTSGAGKTMLARMIWYLYRDHRHGRINQAKSNERRIVRDRGGWMNWGNAVNHRMLEGDFDFINDMRSYPFFVIDDIASEYQRHRELSASKLYDIFEARQNKWTVITANITLEQVSEGLDTRIASRMRRHESDVIEVDVPDFTVR